MRFEFSKPPEEVGEDIAEYIIDKDLPMTTSGQIGYGCWFKISISKWGTSSFEFLTRQKNYVETRELRTVLILVKQDIAYLHKRYIPEFKEKLSKAMEEIGGKKL